MEKILIVEDEQGIRDTLQEILELAGYAVLTACDGKIGYDVIVENQPDLVLCDVNMPELGGFELLEAVNFIKTKVRGVKVLYGGSVNPKNINNLKDIDNIDGFLIGGASQVVNNFIDIIKKTYN